MGKYSDTIITENRNTHCDSEESLVDCLSAVIINEAEVRTENNIEQYQQMCNNEEIAKIESTFGSSDTYDVPLENMDLLVQFESHVSGCRILLVHFNFLHLLELII